MSHNDGNKQNLPDPHANKDPSTSTAPEEEIVRESQLEFFEKDVIAPVPKKDLPIVDVVKKYEQDALIRPFDSDRESTIRNQVHQFFTLFYKPSEAGFNEKYLAGERLMSECVQSLNIGDYFSSSNTLRIRTHCHNCLAQYEDLMDPRSVNSLLYKREMKIRYIPFQLLRIIFNDIIDFIDFLEGSEFPPTSPLGEISLELQSSRIREEFEKGVQQIEFDILHNLENSFDDFVLQNPPKENQHVLTFEIIPRSENKPYVQSPPRISKQFSELAPELDMINNVEVHMKQLTSSRDMLEDIVYSSISRSAAILEFCKRTEIVKFEFTLKRMIYRLSEQLDELKILRKICTRLLAIHRQSNKPHDIMPILKAKVKTALLLRGILTKLSDLFRSFSFEEE